ncbi:hypothetical protein ACP70R_042665 [Stipagrostis hirtigluma subsp. patula]
MLQSRRFYHKTACIVKIEVSPKIVFVLVTMQVHPRRLNLHHARPSLQLSNGKLPVVHRLSPCSPLNGAERNSNPLPTGRRRHAQSLRSLFAARPGVADSMATAPAPPAGVTIPTNITTTPQQPDEQVYTVFVGFGTPAQQLPLGLTNSGLGISPLWCKPCAFGAPNCDPAFDTTRSSTFARVPCGSPGCRSNCSGSVCLLPYPEKGTVVQDVLTLTPTARVHNFTFGCVEVRTTNNTLPRPTVGELDLSRDSRSVASRLAPPGGTPAFSYCLPQSPSSHGFLSLGAGGRRERSGDRVRHAPLVHNPEFPNHYLIEVVGISLGGEDLPIPAAAQIASTTALRVGVEMNYIKSAVYAPLRDAFRRKMSRYPTDDWIRTGDAFEDMDVCYNFTGLHQIEVPLVEFKFGNGESLLLEASQMMYYVDPSAGPFSVACLAFYPLPYNNSPIAVIGTLAQTSTEVVYDVAGGKVGFIPHSC